MRSIESLFSKKAQRFFLAVALILFCSLNASSQTKTVKVGLFPAAPLVFQKDGKAQGLFIDMIEYCAKANNWHIEFVEGTWNELQEKLLNGGIDLLPALGYSSERALVYDFNVHPVYIDNGVVFTSPKFTIHTIYDLNNKRVAGVNGSIFTTGFINYISSFGIKCDIVFTADNKQVMEAITSGKADAGVSVYSLGNELAKQYPVVVTPISYSPTALYYAVRKGKNADMLSAIDTILAHMIVDPNSFYSKSFNKWTMPKQTNVIPAWILGGIAGLSFIGLLLLFWNVTLNRTVRAKTKYLEREIRYRRKAEETLVAEKERLAVTLRSIGDGVITTDTMGNVVIMNKVAEDLCGWKLEEVQGKSLVSVFRIINQSDRMPRENPVEKVLTSGETIELAHHAILVSKDGTERTVSDSGAPIKDKDGRTIGVVLVFRDMTEKDKMMDNMQRIDKLDSLGILAGGIAHDFNNLLGGIFGYIDMAREQAKDDAIVSSYLDKAFGVFERARDLTLQLLTFSKGGAPKRKTGQICQLIKENASFVLSGSNINCEYRIERNLWLADYDENQIGQVIDNIVLNAEQAMPSGGTIVISADNVSIGQNEKQGIRAGNYVKISVADSGVGIPPELLTRIFDPFFTTKQKGNGLGLAMCFSIVQKHEGFIDVESVQGKGSTFYIYLPASHAKEAGDDSSRTIGHTGKGRIIIMDDEVFMRETVGGMLTSMGYTPVEAATGEEALRICLEAKKEGTPIRGALFDLTIPGRMGGKEIIGILRKDFPEMAVFASSGFSEDPIMARPAEFGFTDSIRKPFKKSELAEMLNRYNDILEN